MTWFLDLRVQAKGGGVARQAAVYQDDVLKDASDLKEAARNRDVLIVTHGFNVSREAGRQALSSWETWLSAPASILYVAVLWPGDSAWIPAIDYPIEGNEAISSGKLLADFVTTNFIGNAASLTMVSHSLGARVLLQTLRGIAGKTRVRWLLLMAGAIDDTCLSDEYADAAQVVDRIAVLASHHDEVLQLAFPAGNFFAGIVTRGSPYWHAALGRDGPASPLDGKIRSGWEISDLWTYGHHNYLAQAPRIAPALPLAPPQLAPAVGAPVPTWVANFPDWRSAWSAAVLSTLLN